MPIHQQVKPHQPTELSICPSDTACAPGDCENAKEIPSLSFLRECLACSQLTCPPLGAVVLYDVTCQPANQTDRSHKQPPPLAAAGAPIFVVLGLGVPRSATAAAAGNRPHKPMRPNWSQELSDVTDLTIVGFDLRSGIFVTLIGQKRKLRFQSDGRSDRWWRYTWSAHTRSSSRVLFLHYRLLSIPASKSSPMVCHADSNSNMTNTNSNEVPYAEIVLDGKAAGSLQSAIKYVDMNDLESGKQQQHNHNHIQQGLPLVVVTEKTEQQKADEASKKSFWLLAYCFVGIMVSFTLNGLVLEKMTSHRVLGEMSLTFVFCFFYSVVALGLRAAMKEKPSTMPQSKLIIVGLLAFGSTISSMVALRYVTFITRILGKSCKSIPVMVVGLFLGKSYALKKYVSVIVLSIGVAVFLVGTAHEKQHKAVQTNEIHDHVAAHERTPNVLLGFSLLLLSLLFDGATGALEDKYMEQYHIGAFDLMYTVNIYKCVFAAIGMVVMGEIPTFMEQVVPSLPNLVLLSLTGAMGQAFIFFTISKFGALTTSIIGTCRKVLSIVLSVILFGHILSLEQFIGLAVSFLGIGLNWVRMDCFNKKKQSAAGAKSEKLKDAEALELLESSDDTADSEEDDSLLASPASRDELLTMKPRDESVANREVERGLELVNMWARTHDAQAAAADNTAARAV